MRVSNIHRSQRYLILAGIGLFLLLSRSGLFAATSEVVAPWEEEAGRCIWGETLVRETLAGAKNGLGINAACDSTTILDVALLTDSCRSILRANRAGGVKARLWSAVLSRLETLVLVPFSNEDRALIDAAFMTVIDDMVDIPGAFSRHADGPEQVWGAPAMLTTISGGNRTLCPHGDGSRLSGQWHAEALVSAGQVSPATVSDVIDRTRQFLYLWEDIPAGAAAPEPAGRALCSSNPAISVFVSHHFSHKHSKYQPGAIVFLIFDEGRRKRPVSLSRHNLLCRLHRNYAVQRHTSMHEPVRPWGGLL